MLGTYALSAGYYEAYYKKAQQVRTLIKMDFDEAFKKVDVIITPTTPTPAFKIGEKTHDPLQMYLSDIFTISVNLAGVPGHQYPVVLQKMNCRLAFRLLEGHLMKRRLSEPPIPLNSQQTGIRGSRIYK